MELPRFFFLMDRSDDSDVRNGPAAWHGCCRSMQCHTTGLKIHNEAQPFKQF
jgi:hypothetical protein